MRGNETPGRIVMNFCTGVGVHDVITSANFYDCRLWGLSVVGGQILGFSVDSRRRPYNTLALPCECVIGTNGPRGKDMKRPTSEVRGSKVKVTRAEDRLAEVSFSTPLSRVGFPVL